MEHKRVTVIVDEQLNLTDCCLCSTVTANGRFVSIKVN